MKEKRLISIIVPIFNNEADLEKCIESIRKQTFSALEIILVNDGSTDKSAQICEAYQRKDERIYVVHLEKRGVSRARNVGVHLASGDFIGFVDADDYIEPTMYEKLYKACIETESDIAICKLGREINGKVINRTGATNYRLELTHDEALEELFKGELYRFSLCNKLFRKRCFLNVMFPVGRIHEDLATTYKLFHHANQVVYLNFIGYIYVKRANSILTTPYDRSRLDAFIAWDEIQSFMRENYPQLMEFVNACYTYFSIDHAYYILNEIDNQQVQRQFLSVIRNSIRKWYKDIKIHEGLSLQYKLLMTLMYVHSELFICTHRLNKAKKKLFTK